MNKKATEKSDILTIGLPFNQAEKRLTRKYNKEEALERLEKIKEMKEKRLTIREIVGHFSKSVKER